MNRIIIYHLLILSLLWGISTTVGAQITIGADSKPSSFSMLELSTKNTKGGLRLPRLTIGEIGNLETHLIANPTKAKGLMVYNKDTDCIQIWMDKTKGWSVDCGALNCIPVKFTAQPQDVDIKTNNLLQLAVTVDDKSGAIKAEDMIYQWYKDGVKITTAEGTKNPYKKTLGKPADSGIYHCTVRIVIKNPNSDKCRPYSSNTAVVKITN